MSSPAPLTGSARTFVLVAAGVVAIESIGYLVLAGLDLRDTSSERLGTGIGVAVLLVAYGLGQLVAVRLLLAGRSGARSPLVVIQVIQALIAFSTRGEPALALAVGLPALVVLGCVLAPPVTRALASDAV